MELGRSVLPSTASSAVGAGGTIRALGVTLGWAGGGDGVEDHSQGREPGHLAALRAGRWHPRETVGPEHGFFSPRTVSFGERGACCALQQRTVSFLFSVDVGFLPE